MMISRPHKNNHTDLPREKIKNFRISQRIMMMLIAINILSFLVSDSCADNKFDFDLAPFAFSGEHSSGMIELLMARLGRIDPFLFPDSSADNKFDFVWRVSVRATHWKNAELFPR